LSHGQNEKVDVRLEFTGTDSGNTAPNAGVERSNVGSSRGRSTNTNKKVILFAELRRLSREFRADSQTEWSRAELYWTIDEWDAFAMLVGILWQGQLDNRRLLLFAED